MMWQIIFNIWNEQVICLNKKGSYANVHNVHGESVYVANLSVYLSADSSRLQQRVASTQYQIKQVKKGYCHECTCKSHLL